ncbi:protein DETOXIFICATION 35-like [Solanum pennellii]|uniref:Protein DETOXIFICATION n=1 Tax=Solanum pennellii TaxID=28526 RepID=A0ABM1GBB5_SOLPN|nr:protein DETOXIFICATION 35-like [Solanum pennellii]
MEAMVVSADHHHQLIGNDGDYRPVNGLKQWWIIFWIETVKLWKIGGPIAFNILCQYGIYSITVAFCGHLGALQLSAISIAQNVIGTFSFGFMLGMGSALETLCGQAFGAGQIHMLGIYTQRSMVILLFSTLLLLPIYIFATPLLKLFGQEHEMTVIAGKFALLSIPELFSLAVAVPASKFLQSQSKVGVLACIGFLVLLLHAFLLWLFIYVFNLGINGAALVYNITGWANAIAQFVYVIVWCKDGWTGWSLSALNEIWAFVRLSIASAVMLCLETWYMMSIIVLTGHLKDAVIAVGSLSICMNIDGWEVMLFIGINAAISVRVSNELGQGHPRATKYSVYITMFQSLLIGILCMILVLVVRNHLSILFTNSKDLQRAVADLAWLLGITMVLNSVQPVISGVAIGGGWQSSVAYINLGCYYIFGIPLGCTLGYVANFDVVGLWGGMIAGLALQTLILSFVIYRIDWNKEVEQSAERLRRWGGQNLEAEKTLNSDPAKDLLHLPP